MAKPKIIAALSIAAVGGITASAESRTLAGELVRYGVPGRTSVGRLRVRPGALRFPSDLARVKLTREHELDQSRGYCSSIQPTAGGIRASAKVSEGPEGDAALREAADGTRDSFSFHVVDATVEGDEITDALVIAIGQVGIPAYDDSRIDTIAASAAASTGRNTMLSPEQAQRLLELQAQIDNGQTLSDDDQKEYDALKTLSALQHAAPDTGAGVTASAATGDGNVHVHVHTGVQPAAEVAEVTAAAVPAAPAGAPAPEATGSSTKGEAKGAALRKVVTEVTAALKKGDAGEIKAALTDVIGSDHTTHIEQGGWSGELWSGLQYEPQFSDLFNHGDLTYWEGRGWRFTATPSMQDYAGDKAAIPSGGVTTEDQAWTAARMAVGVDVDRKFYDFPNEGFVNGLFEKVRESWEIQLDAKIKAYVLANAVAAQRLVSATRTNADATVTTVGAANVFRASDVGAPITGTGIPANTTILSVTDAHTIELSANATASGTSNLTIGTQESTLIKAAARAALVLKRRQVGNASWIVVNDEDLFTLLDVNQNAVPAFLDLYNIKPENFRSSADVAPGTVLAGAKQAAEVKTLPGSPIRVSAQHLANGGIDEAFFGYWAIEEHHTSGIASVVFKPAA